MSSSLIARSPDLLRLRNEGFHLVLQGGYLLVHDVPYVNPNRGVERGTLAFRVDLTGDIAVKPQEHTAYFTGKCPCDSQGHPLSAIINNSTTAVVNGITINHYLSAKPRTADHLYQSYYEKVTKYVAQLEGHAQHLTPSVSARTFPVVLADGDEPVFAYEDTASTRAHVGVPTDRLRSQRIAIVGLGGTGAYVLDLVAKTPVAMVHLWDGDILQQHNAFRYPGAVSLETLRAAPTKVGYLVGVYQAMHRHIVPHAEMITADNAHLLRDFDYVFACVDRADARRLILNALEGSSTTLIDVGMGVRMNAAQELLGQCRVTVVDPGRDPVAIATLPLAGRDDENLYATNVQVADLNALNAFMAVETWKKRSGFYASRSSSSLTVYATSNSTMATNEVAPCPV
ncbi:hypothetical protein RHOFW510R12_00370 [Rhodanobacter sp. FW510-R12]|uniref:ThiF family adenylyltransferase n=1 Tax=unclassified Rhodanobacter TaxID=2621553 RepID=UPI0007AA502B|nr:MULTISPECIES: ThiF family adenylyltransferase [unclassified Rhodanobacter]KZC15776.1 hypothetical protein RHOFW104R8_03195 [Rhodanobacter sp. FW104-R8]KZC28357.1 hypothetical protein RhoFW510T8_11930 [Rhodanobacter sp. FW510-T8]KZC32733.1 hypothetical protein RhoFW510R10_11450 [Rhodanobacter sp. FW510-R10]